MRFILWGVVAKTIKPRYLHTAMVSTNPPSVDKFVKILSEEPKWFTLGLFLGAPAQDLREIERKHRETEGIMRCLCELHDCLQRLEKPLSWETIAIALKQIGNPFLAKKILNDHVKPEAAVKIDDVHETLVSEYDGSGVNQATNICNLTQCSSCSVNEKLLKHLNQENSALRDKISTLQLDKIKYAEKIDVLSVLLKQKDAEIASLKETNDDLVKGKKGVPEITSTCTSTAMVPRRELGVKAEMTVKVITRDKNWKQLTTGGSVIRAILSCNKEECPVADINDGSYAVTVIPEQLGAHQLFITVNGQYIQGNPFILDIVPERDYTQISKSKLTTISGIQIPRFIAFSPDGRAFVTSSDDHDNYIHVYNQDGTEKTTIGCGEGKSPLQFQSPHGIAVNGDTIYVAEYSGHRIQQFTTDGKFICMFGTKGSAIGQFNGPTDVKISPTDGKVYIADTYNDRVQVFNPDWSVSHVIDGTVSGDGHFSWPYGIAFDLASNVHVTGYDSYSVTVFDSTGQFVQHYDKTHIRGPAGIAIDSSGYSLINNFKNDTLSIYDHKGVFVNSVGDFYGPFGISISPINGSIWIADAWNHRLVLYNVP